MPEIYVHAVEGRTIDQKRALVKDITDAVVRNFKVKPEAVMVEIVECSGSPRPRAASCSATSRRARQATVAPRFNPPLPGVAPASARCAAGGRRRRARR